MINVQNLTKRYGELLAIKDVTFKVEKGEVLAFLGPNGAGKTTTMRILTGFIPATSGTAAIAGYDIFEDSHEAKKRIGYLPERPPLYHEMTVSEYLLFVAKIKGVDRKVRSSALGGVLEKCALTGVKDRLIGNLSRGFRQRVGLAQALIHNPEVLILDEPTTGLDPKQIIEVRQVIKELAGQHTIILSTHILSEATATCQRVIIIHEGKIVAVDTQERLSTQIRKSDKIRVQLKTPPADAADRLKTLPGVLSAYPEDPSDGPAFTVECALGRDLRPEIASLAVQQGWGLLELRSVNLSLEDVYLKLTEEEDQERSARDRASGGAG